jgi:hypothetical protein
MNKGGEDEGGLFIPILFLLLIAMPCWVIWYRRISRVTRLASSTLTRLPLYISPVLGAAIQCLALVLWSSQDVRDSYLHLYLIAYMAFGFAFLGVAMHLLPYLGLSGRDDAAERDNLGAGLATAAAILALGLCFSGSNIGDGPGPHVVLFCLGLSVGALALVWILLATAGGLTEALTIERDTAAGLRGAGFLLSSGLVFGRAVAGDWVSTGATLADFGRIGWPVLVLLTAAAVVERLARPTPSRPRPAVAIWGVLPALVYAGVAAAYLVWLGPWTAGR